MLSNEEVKNIAALAKLKVSDSEASLYAKQLSAVLEYMEQLEEVDVDLNSIDWKALMPDFSNRLGEDVAYDWPEDEKEIALSQSEREGDLIKVKKVL